MSPERKLFLKQRFGPLLNPFFRALVLAQFFSFVGTWMQEITRSWWVLDQGGQSTKMGMLMFAMGLPVLIFWPIGGILADRSSTKKILLITQFFLAITALTASILFFTQKIEFWHLVAIAFVEGLLIVFDAPAFQVFTREMLKGEDFQQGLSINSVSFHLSRVVGPSVAGVLLSFLPLAWIFFINGISFLILVVVISRLPYPNEKDAISHQGAPHLKPHKNGFSFHDIKELFSFLKTHPILLRCFFNFWIVMTFIFPLVFTTLRTFLKSSLHLDAHSFGTVFAAPGFGAMVASLVVLFLKPKEPYRLTPMGTVIALSGLAWVLNSHSSFMAFCGLFVFSFGMFLFLNSNVLSLNLLVANSLRGRMSSLIGVAFTAWAPVMSLFAGTLTDKVGTMKGVSFLAVSFLFLIFANYKFLSMNVSEFGLDLKNPTF
jgi:MFS family permease